MTVIDPGHKYELAHLDGVGVSRLTFVKREGPGYPGNVGRHEGTNAQEVMRTLIDRLSYLYDQDRCWHDLMIISLLRHGLVLLEERAARRHGRELKMFPGAIENVPTCAKCGHIQMHWARQAYAMNTQISSAIQRQEDTCQS